MIFKDAIHRVCYNHDQVVYIGFSQWCKSWGCKGESAPPKLLICEKLGQNLKI